MKVKIVTLIMLVFIVSIINFNQKIFAEEKNYNNDTLEKIYVNENKINIQIDSSGGTIDITNQYFNINTNFNLYTIKGFAIAKNTVILDCEDSCVMYLGLNFKTNKLNYIIKSGNIYYYSSNIFRSLISSFDFNDENAKKELLYSNQISYEDDNDKNIHLRKAAVSAFICFNIFHESNFSKSAMYSNSNYELTGDSLAINDLYFFIDSGFFNVNQFVTEGVSYNVIYDIDGKISYIYAIDTAFEEPWNVFASSIKIWEVSYHVFVTSTNTGVTLNFSPYKEFYLVSDEFSGIVTACDEGESNFGLEDISFVFTTTEFSYISQYSIVSINQGNYETPSVLSFVDNLFVKFIPKYQHFSQILHMFDSGTNYINQIFFDNDTQKFCIYEDEETTRCIGFKLSSDDIDSSIFNEKWLYNYSFYQTLVLCDVPNYDINAYLRININIFTSYYDEISLTYLCNMSINNGRNCNHQKTSTHLTGEIYSVSCNLCNYSFKEIHNFLYENYDSINHVIKCEKCDCYYYENHQFKNITGGKECEKCGYFISTHTHTYSYLSCGDKKQHLKSCVCGFLMRENCIGISNGSKFICGKCGQELLINDGPTLMSIIDE